MLIFAVLIFKLQSKSVNDVCEGPLQDNPQTSWALAPNENSWRRKTFAEYKNWRIQLSNVEIRIKGRALHNKVSRSWLYTRLQNHVKTLQCHQWIWAIENYYVFSADTLTKLNQCVCLPWHSVAWRFLRLKALPGKPVAPVPIMLPGSPRRPDAPETCI